MLLAESSLSVVIIVYTMYTGNMNFELLVLCLLVSR